MAWCGLVFFRCRLTVCTLARRSYYEASLSWDSFLLVYGLCRLELSSPLLDFAGSEPILPLRSFTQLESILLVYGLV